MSPGMKKQLNFNDSSGSDENRRPDNIVIDYFNKDDMFEKVPAKNDLQSPAVSAVLALSYGQKIFDRSDKDFNRIKSWNKSQNVP